ncbi:unnamed protein product [Polarella glacialis]|uniref:Uncharacterized protein n=1 Tax=Polarella glacialis TaxID=89957 RepID=A0A813DXX2_POLGL|nr:unnamed protein product [Polarella glacialis]
MATSTAGLAAAGAAAATGFGLFGYNRENFLYDAELRFERFSAGREFAIAQQEQFRSDIRALSALTAKKNGIYAVVATLDMALCVALYCAGRLGLHGPAPPGWIMALWLTNNAASFGFMAVAIMLAMHAMLRAQSASAHLLTRKIRVPVPSLKQLDKARKFASEFEQQNWTDIFRVPYMSNNGAPKTDDKAPKTDDRAGRSRSESPGRRPTTNKASSWIRDEYETDRAGTVSGTAVNNLPGDVAPEHFRLYAACQKEWVEYDVYARVAIFMGFVCYIQSLAYYGLGHINIELKAFWVAFATSLTITMLQVLILRFDLVSGRQRKKERLPGCQWCGPLATVFASVGMALDFTVKFDTTMVAISWVFIFGAYILQFVYALRLLELVLPDNVIGKFKAQESIGDAWWPASWENIPSTFAHVLYIVAPPTRLQPGQFDTVRETIYGSGPDPFDSAGEPIGAPGAARKVDPSQDVAAQANYLDSVFEWALSEQVFENLSESSKKTVQDNFASYSGAKRDMSTGAKVFQDVTMSMEAVIAFEGAGEKGAPGGYNSDSGGSAGSSDEEAEEPDYTWDGRKVAAKEAGLLPAKSKGMPPWRMVSAVQTVLCACWVFMIMAMVVDYFIGDQGLVTAPHWSKPPMSRMSLPHHELGTPLGFPWYAGAKPFIPEQFAWHEEKRDPEGSVIVGLEPPKRRLSSDTAVVDHGSNLLSAINGIMNMIPSQPAMADGHALSVSWPGFFEPRLLACGPHGIAALTPRGVGALVTATSEQQTAQSFRLSGLMNLPALLSASWQASEELLVVTHAGDLASCPRPVAGDVWACGAAHGGRLPLPEGTRLLAAAVSWISSSTGKPRLHAAFIDKAVPDLVALFALAGAGDTSSWVPMGEVQVPDSDKASLSFVGDGELLITTGAGAILRRRLQDGAVMASSTHPWGGSHASLQWQAACGLHHGPEGSLAHLRLYRAEGTQAWLPEIVASNLKDLASGLPLFQ